MSKRSRLRALESQTHHLQRRLERLHRTSYRLSWIRFVVFFAALLAAGLTSYLAGIWLGILCAGVGGLLFGLVVYIHHRINLAIRRHQLWLEATSTQIARATLDWEQIPVTFHHRPDPDHPFEVDLDIVGQRSLHRLLDTAVSYEGSQHLKDWLTAPLPEPQRTTGRQQVVRELAPRHLFRGRLALNGKMAAGAKRTWRANQLMEWLEGHAPEASLRRWVLVFAAFIALNLILFVANQLGSLAPWWQVTLVIYLGLILLRSGPVDAAWDAAMALEGALRQLRAVFGQLETFSYRDTPHLRELCRPFLDSTHRPSQYLARITRVLVAMSLRSNPLLRLMLNALVPWDAYFAYRLNQTRAEMAPYAGAWMDAWFELEALASLANLAYLNPDYTFPRLLVEGEQKVSPVFQTQDLGHPLIPDGERICNSLTVSEMGQVTIITGSNMAGKSVFLKTVGVNLALAFAGGPVNAQSLETVPFRLFTCMGISDSVTDGISYFYAEVKRLKALLAELESDQPWPLLFCIDEIFRGTNNRERLIGSRAYVRALTGKRGLGFIATHDLELAKLADEVPQVVNYHFRDHVVDDRMAFDYTLRPGPCPTTNALTIMQLEGLPVPSVPQDATHTGGSQA
jgi:hypothetical protein